MTSPRGGFISPGEPTYEALTTSYRRVIASGSYRRVGLCAGNALLLAVINREDTTPPGDDSEAIVLEGRDSFVGLELDGRGLWLRSNPASSVTVIRYQPILADSGPQS